MNGLWGKAKDLRGAPRHCVASQTTNTMPDGVELPNNHLPVVISLCGELDPGPGHTPSCPQDASILCNIMKICFVKPMTYTMIKTPQFSSPFNEKKSASYCLGNSRKQHSA